MNEQPKTIGVPFEPTQAEWINARLQGAIVMLKPLLAPEMRTALIEVIRDNPHISDLPLVIGYIAGIFYTPEVMGDEESEVSDGS